MELYSGIQAFLVSPFCSFRQESNLSALQIVNRQTPVPRQGIRISSFARGHSVLDNKNELDPKPDKIIPFFPYNCLLQKRPFIYLLCFKSRLKEKLFLYKISCWIESVNKRITETSIWPYLSTTTTTL